jgi:hypothetical protein
MSLTWCSEGGQAWEGFSAWCGEIATSRVFMPTERTGPIAEVEGEIWPKKSAEPRATARNAPRRSVVADEVLFALIPLQKDFAAPLHLGHQQKTERII